jgi:hypothetical protein
MLSPAPLRELLLIALFAARGWFIAVFLAGLLLLAAGLGLGVSPLPKAVALAFFLPLLSSALFGTFALGTYRARQESVQANTALRKCVFRAAVIWNCFMGLVALAVDQVVIYFGLLSRAPFEFPHSVGIVLAMSAGVALLAIYPRQGPQ